MYVFLSKKNYILICVNKKTTFKIAKRGRSHLQYDSCEASKIVEFHFSLFYVK